MPMKKVQPERVEHLMTEGLKSAVQMHFEMTKESLATYLHRTVLFLVEAKSGETFLPDSLVDNLVKRETARLVEKLKKTYGVAV